jgi:hypothetical protein
VIGLNAEELMSQLGEFTDKEEIANIRRAFCNLIHSSDDSGVTVQVENLRGQIANVLQNDAPSSDTNDALSSTNNDAKEEMNITDVLHRVLSFLNEHYSADDNVRKPSCSGRGEIRHRYDALGRPIEREASSTGVERFFFQAPVSQARTVVQYHYDAQGHPVSSSTHHYDAQSNLIPSSPNEEEQNREIELIP